MCRPAFFQYRGTHKETQKKNWLRPSLWHRAKWDTPESHRRTCSTRVPQFCLPSLWLYTLPEYILCQLHYVLRIPYAQTYIRVLLEVFHPCTLATQYVPSTGAPMLRMTSTYTRQPEYILCQLHYVLHAYTVCPDLHTSTYTRPPSGTSPRRYVHYYSVTYKSPDTNLNLCFGIFHCCDT
jgi:hypothetical protein